MNCVSCTLALPMCVALLGFAETPRRGWTPGSSSLRLGVIVRAHVLSYQWSRGHASHDEKKLDAKARALTAEQSAGVDKWESSGTQWFWADPERNLVNPLKDAMPEHARAFSRVPDLTWFKPQYPAFRWRVGSGYLWAMAIDPLSSASWGAWLERMTFPVQESYETWRAAVARAGYAPGLVKVSRISFPPANTVPGGVLFDFDFLPLSARDVKVVELANDKLVLWELPQDHGDRSQDRAIWVRRWRQRAILPAPFCEPFHLAAADGAYFFVTDSGAVYMAEETKREWKTRAVWKDPSRPIIAMLAEADSPGGFVFGKDFYFRLGRELKAKPCEDVTKGRPDLTDPMRTVFQCGLVLHKNGELSKAAAAK